MDIADGSYDVFVVDVRETAEGAVFDLTFTSGEHKGDVVSIRTTMPFDDAFAMLGEPRTLLVAAGRPMLSDR